MNTNKIINAIKDSLERYPETSGEHIEALLELYGNERIKNFKHIVINRLKDLIEQPNVSKQEIQEVISELLNLNT